MKQKTRLYRQTIYTLLGLAIGLSGCSDSDSNSDDATLTSMTGYWVGRTAHAGSKRADLPHFFYLEHTGNTVTMYNVCKKTAIAEGTIDGETLSLNQKGKDVNFINEAKFYKGALHDITHDGGRWTARRIEQPQCGAAGTAMADKVIPQHIQVLGVNATSYTQGRVNPDEDADPFSLASTNCTGTESSDTGCGHLNASAGSVLMAQTMSSSTPGAVESKSCVDYRDQGVTCPATPTTATPGVVQCSIQDWTDTEISKLDATTTFVGAEDLWPGAIMRGDRLAVGAFDKVGVEPAGSTVFLTGVYLSSGQRQSFYVDKLDGSSVNDGIKSILDRGVQGQVASFDYDVYEVHSEEHLKFSLGVGVEGSIGNLHGSLGINTDDKRNNVLVKFTQVYYTAAINDPYSPVGFFKDGVNFSDPYNHIGQGKPPIYISNVKYGRQVFLLLKTRYSALDVKAAVDGAYNGAVNVTFRTNVDYKKVMADAQVKYIVQGGNVEEALKPLDGSAEDMFDRVKKYIVSAKAATWSPQSPGIPVAFTGKYLVSNTIAEKAEVVAAAKKSCRLLTDRPFDYKVRYLGIDDQMFLTLKLKMDPNSSPQQIFYTNNFSMDWREVELTDLLTTDEDYTLNLVLNNNHCGWSTGAFQIVADNVVVKDYFYRHYVSHCGDTLNVSLTLNRNVGTVGVTSEWWENYWITE